MTAAEIYETTLPVIATQNLIMGLTLLSIYRKNGTTKPQYRIGIRLLGVAMLMISAINYIEYLIPTNLDENQLKTLSITIFAASIQLLLLVNTSLSLMRIREVSPRRFIIELLIIILFTFPATLIDPQSNPALFFPLFYTGLTYYIIKYMTNLYIYSKAFTTVKANIKNYYSDENKKVLNWIKSNYIAIIILGAVSIFVPLTNYTVLVLYQIFIFGVYFYIYWEVICHEQIFNDIQLIDDSKKNNTEIKPEHNVDSILMFDKWILERHYATPGLTIEDVAQQLNTNRTTLSLYLNSELNLSFYEWISKIRVDNAMKILIEHPTLPIAEIAIYVGIEDRSNFDKLFKRIIGVSPSGYRILYANKELKIKELPTPKHNKVIQ